MQEAGVSTLTSVRGETRLLVPALVRRVEAASRWKIPFDQLTAAGGLGRRGCLCARLDRIWRAPGTQRARDVQKRDPAAWPDHQDMHPHAVAFAGTTGSQTRLRQRTSKRPWRDRARRGQVGEAPHIPLISPATTPLWTTGVRPMCPARGHATGGWWRPRIGNRPARKRHMGTTKPGANLPLPARVKHLLPPALSQPTHHQTGEHGALAIHLLAPRLSGLARKAAHTAKRRSGHPWHSAGSHRNGAATFLLAG